MTPSERIDEPERGARAGAWDGAADRAPAGGPPAGADESAAAAADEPRGADESAAAAADEPRGADESAAAGADEPQRAGAPAGGPPPDGDEPASQVAGDLDELVRKARERDEFLAMAQRAQADFENYRKRAARDAAAAERRGSGRLAKELLPALDNLDRALASADEGSDAGLAEGVRLVQGELLAALSRAGIEPFSPGGEQFDPNEHEAMASHPVEGAASGTVVEVYQQGYRLGDSVLRPARVVVAA